MICSAPTVSAARTSQAACASSYRSPAILTVAPWARSRSTLAGADTPGTKISVGTPRTRPVRATRCAAIPAGSGDEARLGHVNRKCAVQAASSLEGPCMLQTFELEHDRPRNAKISGVVHNRCTANQGATAFCREPNIILCRHREGSSSPVFTAWSGSAPATTGQPGVWRVTSDPCPRTRRLKSPLCKVIFQRMDALACAQQACRSRSHQRVAPTLNVCCRPSQRPSNRNLAVRVTKDAHRHLRRGHP